MTAVSRYEQKGADFVRRYSCAAAPWRRAAIYFSLSICRPWLHAPMYEACSVEVATGMASSLIDAAGGAGALIKEFKGAPLALVSTT